MPLRQLGRWILKVPGAHHHKNWNSPARENTKFHEGCLKFTINKMAHICREQREILDSPFSLVRINQTGKCGFVTNYTSLRCRG